VQTNSLNYTNADLREPCTPAMTSTMEYGVCRYHITRTITLSLSLSLSRELHRLKMLLFATLVNYAPIIKLLSSTSYRLSGERVASRRVAVAVAASRHCGPARLHAEVDGRMKSPLPEYTFITKSTKRASPLYQTRSLIAYYCSKPLIFTHRIMCVCVCLFARRKTHSTNLNHVARTFS